MPVLRCYPRTVIVSFLALLMTFLIALLLGLLVDATRPQPLAAQEGDAAAIEAGKTVFSLNCSNEFCHGPKGGGNFLGTPNAQKLTDNKWFHTDGSYAGLVTIITAGVTGSPMQPWAGKLSAERIRQVAAYVKSLNTP